MSSHTPSECSKSSVVTSSGKSLRSGKSVGAKIRELGFEKKSTSKRNSAQSNSLKYVQIKTETNRPSDISVMIPTLNLEQIMYYQPEVKSTDTITGSTIYKIQKFNTQSKGPKEITKITDIEVKSVKPTKKMAFRKKKTRSSVISRIQEIFNRGKGPPIMKDPSEETVFMVSELETITPKHINDLPESILQKIFLYIGQRERAWTLTRVCRLWYFILKDPMFWLELEFKGDRVPTNDIMSLIKRYTSLETLRLISVPGTVEILQELCRCNNIIKALKIKDCDVNNKDFARIILHVVFCCTKLEVLDIKGMQFQSERFYLVLGRLKNLRRLTLSGNKYLKKSNLITVAINCRSLQELRILNINSDNADTTLTDDDVVFIFSHLQQNLKTLKMDMQQLGNISFQAIMQCSNLRNLALENCLNLTGDAFRQLAALKKLKKLKLTRAINLKPEDFQAVFNSESMQSIEHLDINGCWGVGEVGFQVITRKLKSLKSLSIKNCKSITGKSILLLSNCPNLVSLNIAHTKIDPNQLLLLPQHVKDLQNLVIDANMSKKSKTQKLKKAFPSLSVRLSISEYQSEERILQI